VVKYPPAKCAKSVVREGLVFDDADNGFISEAGGWLGKLVCQLDQGDIVTAGMADVVLMQHHGVGGVARRNVVAIFLEVRLVNAQQYGVRALADQTVRSSNDPAR